jgi:3-hydroxyisobutyrate dehydrogenase-like beta-hydroxyacid dehydrogenase
MTTTNIAFVGFGEAAMAFRSGWGDQAPSGMRAFDIKTLVPATATAMIDRYAANGIVGAESLGAALEGATLAFSLVTADQALVAARQAAEVLPKGLLWLDCNSCSPDSKRAAAEAIEGAGGAYVDVAVMAPVHPKKHHVPLLVSGPHAERAEAILKALDMRPAVVGGGIGGASAVKMLRSVMIKGLEALTAECFLAARRAGVEEAVIASLKASDPGIDWTKRGSYNLERMMVHGTRRAAEMAEVVATVEALGLPARMAHATENWQAAIGAMGLEGGEDDLGARADKVLGRI